MRRAHGASLVELCVALVLVAALSGGVKLSLGGLVTAHRDRTAVLQLAQAKEALLGFVQSHGHLPCPADPRESGHAGRAGIAAAHRDGDCSAGYGGLLPWVTLGLPGQDPWGERIRYRVVVEFADARDDCTGANDARRSICVTETSPTLWPAHADALEVRRRTRSGTAAGATEPIAVGLAAVLVSHGANRSGSATASRPGDEQRNAAPDTVSFIARPLTDAAVDCSDRDPRRPSCAFDDHLAWISRGEVMRRAARAGRDL